MPTIQLLHCQASAADGGDTVLVDGFAAAHRLRVEDPRSFGVLTRTPVPFGYPVAGLRAYQPLIELSPEGRIRGIRFNNRSLQALRRPPSEVTAFYVAYRTVGGPAGPAGTGPDPAAGPGRLPDLRQHPGAARADRVHQLPGTGCCRAVTRTWTRWRARWPC